MWTSSIVRSYRKEFATVSTLTTGFLVLGSYTLPFPTKPCVLKSGGKQAEKWLRSPTLHAAALSLLVKMVRRGSSEAAATALAGARRVAVRTGSRHCCVGNQAVAAAALRLQCRESETSPSRRADGTLRHPKAAARSLGIHRLNEEKKSFNKWFKRKSRPCCESLLISNMRNTVLCMVKLIFIIIINIINN